MDHSNGALWAITAFFNPMGYQRRLENFRTFRNRLQVPLIAVEMSAGAEFQLDGGDADILIRVGGADVMFQKERLLNVGLAALPPECEALAWLDCDLVFEDLRWPEHTLDALVRHRLVQTFQTFHELPPDAAGGTLEQATPTATRRVWAEELGSGSLSSDVLATDFRLRGLVSGGTMACRRELVEDIGLYDACIMGSGVRAVCAAAIGRPSDASAYMHFTPAWQTHYRAWAERFHEKVGGNVGFVPGAVRHLWHGDLANRRYGPRHAGFAQFQFDPTLDVRTNASGGFQWSSDKPAMHRFVREYFESRREGG